MAMAMLLLPSEVFLSVMVMSADAIMQSVDAQHVHSTGLNAAYHIASHRIPRLGVDVTPTAALTHPAGPILSAPP